MLFKNVARYTSSKMPLTDETITQCVNYIKNTISISYETDIVIDPCAVTGDLIKALDKLVKFSFYYHLNPSHPDIQPVDFRLVDFPKFDKTILSGLWYDSVHIISCPAEAEAANLLEKCGEYADSISFIMPVKGEPCFHLPNYALLLTAEINETYSLKIWRRKTG